MEQAETYRLKLDRLRNALSGFENALQINFREKSELEIDLLKNGQIQKFEYCIELFWKTVKSFLLVHHGLECFSPKSCIKNFFQATDLSEHDYEMVMEMISQRNKLSYIYEQSEFEMIHRNLTGYLPVLKKCLKLFTLVK